MSEEGQSNDDASMVLQFVGTLLESVGHRDLKTVTVQLSGNLNCCEEGAKQFIKTYYFYWQSQKEYNCEREKSKV